MLKKFILYSLLLPAMTVSAGAAEFESARDAVDNMRIGWNLGNTLDSNSGDLENMWIEMWSDRTPAAYETAWGQPVVIPELFKMFKDAGFNAVRVPVTWYPHMGAKMEGQTWDPVADPISMTVDRVWLDRVHEVVDYVLAQDMYCIINIHHDTGAASTHWLIAGEEEYAAQKERFEAVWTQIAEEFNDCGERLLFEGYNEMLDPYNSWCFASFATKSKYDAAVAASAYNAINSYAQSFVNAVRATGGNNATRNLIVSTYGACSGEGTWNTHLQDPLKQMKLPTDNVAGHIIMEVHSYTGLSSGLSAAKSSVSKMMTGIRNNLESKGAPVIFGEWGTDNGEDYNNRRADMTAFLRYFVEQAHANGFGTFYWMGLSDGQARSVPEFNQPELVEAIVKGYYGEGGFDSIDETPASDAMPAIYIDLMGRRHDHPVDGINIVVMSDGSVRKILR